MGKSHSSQRCLSEHFTSAQKLTVTVSQDHVAVETWVYWEAQGAFVSSLLVMELPTPGFLLPCQAEEEGSATAISVHAQLFPDGLT